MKDIQNQPALVRLAIDRVGVKNLRVPLVVRDQAQGRQHTVAQTDLAVDLPEDFKGTHMSRFVEALGQWGGVLDYGSLKTLLQDVGRRLGSRRSHVCFRFPYFQEQRSPVSGSLALMDYACSVDGQLDEEGLSITLGVEVPVMTVCPCSLAICDQGAHSQRATVRIAARFRGLVWIEELIAIGQTSASSPVYALLKREDEKFVTEQGFANPLFVEDVVRNAARKLLDHQQITWFKVEVESYESIHNHSAYAIIEQD